MSFLNGAIMAVHTHGVTRAGGRKDRLPTIIPPPLPSLRLLEYWSVFTSYVDHDYPVAPSILFVTGLPSRTSLFPFHLYSWVPFSPFINVKYWGKVLLDN